MYIIVIEKNKKIEHHDVRDKWHRRLYTYIKLRMRMLWISLHVLNNTRPEAYSLYFCEVRDLYKNKKKKI